MFPRTPSKEKTDGRASGDWAQVVRDLGPYLGIGTSLAATILLGLGGGYWLDSRLGTRPWFFLLGGVLGLGLALYQFFKTAAGLKQ